MRDESEIELNEFEKQLTAIPLPKSQLNSADTMYQAGWAAAMASTNWVDSHRSSSVGNAGPATHASSTTRWRVVAVALGTLSCCLSFLLLQAKLTPSGELDSTVTSGQLARDESSVPLDHQESLGYEPKSIAVDPQGTADRRLAERSPTFFQAILGKSLASSQVNINQKRIDQALASFEVAPDLSTQIGSTQIGRVDLRQPMHNFVPISADHLLQELFPSAN